MKQIKELIQTILTKGKNRQDRTGTGTTSIFGYQLRFDLTEGFPAVTTKKLAFNAMKAELLWFLEGSTNERRLAEITHGTTDSSKTTIWTPNAENQGKALGYTDGELGPVYGKQWRDFSGVDQIGNLVHDLKHNPSSRRHIVSAWNPAELPQMALPPCHSLFQCYVEDGELSLQLYQRSCDVFLGLPFNVASYALLLEMLAKECNYKAKGLVITLGDAHIYSNHVEQCKVMLERAELKLPKLWLNPEVNDLLGYSMGDIQLIGYESHGAISAVMAV